MGHTITKVKFLPRSQYCAAPFWVRASSCTFFFFFVSSQLNNSFVCPHLCCNESQVALQRFPINVSTAQAGSLPYILQQNERTNKRILLQLQRIKYYHKYKLRVVFLFSFMQCPADMPRDVSGNCKYGKATQPTNIRKQQQQQRIKWCPRAFTCSTCD